MRVLFDHNIPSGTARALVRHQVTEAIDREWQRISNGQLLANAEEAGFDVFLTADKRIRYQQNLKGRRLAIVVIGNPTWRVLRKYLDRVTAADVGMLVKRRPWLSRQVNPKASLNHMQV